MVDLQYYRDKITAQQAEHRVLAAQLGQEQGKLSALEQDIEATTKARAIFQQAALETQNQLQVRLSSLVSTALAAVFPDDNLEFRIQFEPKRGRTECILEVGENGVFNPPMDAHGGGVVDVVSFALRMSFWSMQRTRPTLILDEPLKFLSPNLIPLAAEMLRAMSDKLGVQIIMVSHIIGMQDIADCTFEIDRKDNISYIKGAQNAKRGI